MCCLLLLVILHELWIVDYCRMHILCAMLCCCFVMCCALLSCERHIR